MFDLLLNPTLKKEYSLELKVWLFDLSLTMIIADHCDLLTLRFGPFCSKWLTINLREESSAKHIIYLRCEPPAAWTQTPSPHDCCKQMFT